MSLNLTPHFTLHEFMRSTTGERFNIENRASANEVMRLVKLAEYMERVRNLFDRPVIVTSAFRSQEINRRVGGVVNSCHVQGYAIDFKISGISTANVCKAIVENNFKYHQLIDEFSQWVHLSINPAGRQQNLKAVKINGKTHYNIANF